MLIHYEDGEAFAAFKVIDENTLTFKSAAVPLFTDEGARYVSPQSDYTGNNIPRDIFNKIYLGVIFSEVEKVLGICDFEGSGMDF